MMSASPSKELEQEVGEREQSTDEQDHQELMDRGTQEAQQQPVFDFEVKEQDRWLPIANGMLYLSSFICWFLEKHTPHAT